MTKERKPNPVYTINWVMKDKGVIKFIELPNDTYTISPDVLKYDLDKYGIKKDVRVEVGLEGETVVFLKVAKRDSKPTETKKEEAPKAEEPKKETPSGDVYEWTISGVPTNKEVMNFKEGKVKWYQVPKEIQDLDFNALGIKAKARVRVTVGTLEVKGEQKPSITSIDVIKEEVKTETPPASNDSQEKTKEQPYTRPEPENERDAFYRVKQLENQVAYLKEEKSRSIESQGAVERAFTLVAALVTAQEIKIEKVKETITEYAQHAYDTVQKLKG